jgi:transcriptional regulator with XRE-family HTH domain
MTITGAQVKAARELLGWTLLGLGYRARVSEPTISAFEGSRRSVRPDKVEAIRITLETAGVIFVEENGEGPGVRLRKSIITSAENGEVELKFFDTRSGKPRK